MSKKPEPKFSVEHVAEVLNWETERIKRSKNSIRHSEHTKEAVRAEYELMQKMGTASMHQLAKKYNVAVSTVHQWINNDPYVGGHQRNEMVERLKEKAGAKLWGLAHEVLDGITPEKVQTASLRDNTVSAGILVDKAILIENNGAQKLTLGIEYDNIANDKRMDVIDITSQLERNKKLLAESEESGS